MKGERSTELKKTFLSDTTKRTMLESYLVETYTIAKPCVVDDDEATEPFSIWLKVNNQSFMLTQYAEDREHANWIRLMLAKALATIVENEKPKEISNR